MHTIRVSGNKKSVNDTPGIPVIAFISPVPVEQSDSETRRAFETLQSFPEFRSKFVTIHEFQKSSKRGSQFDVVWIHRSSTSIFNPDECGSKFLNALETYVENGGKLLLSQQAAHYLNLFGLEREPLQDSLKPCRDDGYGRRLGFHAFRDHPLFTGLNGGAYLCRPSNDITTVVTGFYGAKKPENGKVIAVDWDYIFLREDSKLVLEYAHGKGKALSVGGYMIFALPNSNSAHLELFTKNCFRYLTGQFAGAAEHYWEYQVAGVIECPPKPESDRLIAAVPRSFDWEPETSPIDIKKRFATDNFWDVAGERLLVMGTEKGGIEEVWAHPFMAFRDYEAGIRFAYQDTIYWLGDERPEIEVSPAMFTRQYQFKRAFLKEMVVADPQDPVGAVHYEYRGVYPAELVVRFKSNLRWMWPYSDRVTGTICHSWDSDLNAIMIRDGSGDLNLIIGANREPSRHLSGQFDKFTCLFKDSLCKGKPTELTQVAGMMVYKLAMNDNLDLIYAASADGYEKTYAAFSQSLRDPEGIFRRARQHCASLFENSLLLTTPDSNFNRGYRWALLATDRFFVNTPGMGKALVAGYSTTRFGWDGGHKVNGRPGYGWYFGRDAEWSGFALLDYGDFGKVKSQLEFFNRYQDLNGKILHEASTSGLIHYDAADATPLYIVLAGKYFRHSNDTAFLKQTWPNVKRAIDFCFSTDTDGDHLIENTNVGHGWVEGGELYGSHSTIYMAGAWGAALREANTMGTYLKDRDADRYRSESDTQQQLIDENFWSEERQFFAYGKNLDGSYRRDQTILPTVPIYFRMTDREKSTAALKSIAGNSFTTNWGARILREDSPLFKPTGYHYGSVWPLFTGWASLAEYRTGNPIQAFSHLMNNLNVYKSWGLGFVEEVLNGSEYKPSGVCAHQCWSETMVLQPAIEGMLGLDVRAQERKIVLAPQFPPQWDSVTVQHIRMGDQMMDFNVRRTGSVYEFRFSIDRGKPVTVEFMPAFPAGTQITGVFLDGKPVPFTSFKTFTSISLMTTVTVRTACRLAVETSSGISVQPIITDPKPGDPAEGMRILAAQLHGNIYEVEAEGKANTSGILNIWCPRGADKSPVNARFLDQEANTCRYAVDFEPSESKYVKKIVRVRLNP